MKILHIGFLIPGLCEALNNAASEYIFFDWSEWTALPNNINNLHDATIKVANEFQPDITFLHIQAPDIYDHETVAKIPGFKLHWTWDYRPNPTWMYELANAVSITGFTNELDVQRFKDVDLKSCFLQSGYDDKIYTPLGTTKDYPDIVFMGNNYKNEGPEYNFGLGDYRIKMVEFLWQRYETSFDVYGFGWRNPMQNFMYRESKEAECYRSAKIAINLSHYEIERYTSDRMLRILGSGVFCLSQWYPGIEKDFIDGEHLRVWKTFEELAELIDYYLIHEEERKQIAANGHQLVKKKYTWNNMVYNIIELIQ
jgi:glycosyltransferase involved in cell wall biosynthesis